LNNILLIFGCSRDEEPLPRDSRIIVLLYHRIVEGEATNLYERSVTDFESDLRYLLYNNIEVISFEDLNSVKSSGKMPERNAAIITFDDGDRSWFTLVRPIIMKYKMEATFFLWTSMMGKDSFLSWNDVTNMSYYMLPGGVRPFRFGSHSFSHQFLLERKSSFENDVEYNLFLDYELRESKKIIETYIPLPVMTLALPFGDGPGDPEIILAAQRNGYNFIRTSYRNSIDSSKNLDLFSIPALPVLNNTSQEEIGYYLGI
jgi:hypothetical protein